MRTHNIRKKQTSMPSEGFETAIPRTAADLVLDGAATRTGN